MKIRGHREVVSNIRSYARKFEAAKRRSIRQRSFEILMRAVAFAPEDEGELRGSGRLEESPTGRSVTVVFGGPGMPYVVAVHEHLSEHSPYSWRMAEATGRGINWTIPGTGPKFLERAINEKESTLLYELAQDLHFDRL
jgi:hypothetical protein